MIDRGGFGNIWLAEDESGAEIVVKTMRERVPAYARERFACEIALTAAVAHRSIVRAVGDGECDGERFLALERVRGLSLAALIEDGPLSAAAALCVCAEIADALAHVHDFADENGPRGIIHGDVSPENIIVDRSGHAHLIDFGCASARDLPHDPTKLVGKAGYLAPELVEDGEVDARCDQYALGVVFWEALGGRRLFSERRSVRTGPVLPPSMVNASATPFDDALVMRMIAEEPDARFPTTQAAADALAARVAPLRVDGERELCDRVALAERRARPTTTSPTALMSDAHEKRALSSASTELVGVGAHP